MTSYFRFESFDVPFLEIVADVIRELLADNHESALEAFKHWNIHNQKTI